MDQRRVSIFSAYPNVRFGSKADICSAKRHVRFTPDSDIDCAFRHVCFGPKADIQRRLPALALEQALCVYLDCRCSPLFLSVCDTSNSSKANKKDCGFWRGAVTIVGAQVRCLL